MATSDSAPLTPVVPRHKWAISCSRVNDHAVFRILIVNDNERCNWVGNCKTSKKFQQVWPSDDYRDFQSKRTKKMPTASARSRNNEKASSAFLRPEVSKIELQRILN
ncbi:hypothetical protein ACFS07_32085 [Undibacterium arcticum]